MYDNAKFLAPGMSKRPMPAKPRIMHPANDENDSYLKPGQPDLDDARGAFTAAPKPMGQRNNKPGNPMLDAMKRRLSGQ
jgi:hypothetical protein